MLLHSMKKEESKRSRALRPRPRLKPDETRTLSLITPRRSDGSCSCLLDLLERVRGAHLNHNKHGVSARERQRLRAGCVQCGCRVASQALMSMAELGGARCACAHARGEIAGAWQLASMCVEVRKGDCSEERLGMHCQDAEMPFRPYARGWSRKCARAGQQLSQSARRREGCSSARGLRAGVVRRCDA